MHTLIYRSYKERRGVKEANAQVAYNGGWRKRLYCADMTWKWEVKELIYSHYRGSMELIYTTEEVEVKGLKFTTVHY